LFQVGEFAFVLAITGLTFGLISHDQHQLFLAVSIVTMGLSPFALQHSDSIIRRLFAVFLPRDTGERLDRLMRVRKEVQTNELRVLKDHVVIIGFGLNGQNVARAAQSAKIRCAVIEEDPDLAELALSRGLHVVHGDAANDHVIEKAHVERARVVVVAIADAETTSRIVANVRARSMAYLIVRTRYVKEIEANLAAGANEVIPEEFETSIEIFYRVLRKYLVSERSIQEMVAHIRGDHYGMFRSTPEPAAIGKNAPEIGGLEIATVPVDLGRTRIAGRTLEQIDLRGRFGITLLAIRRRGRTITQMPPGERILQDDVLYLLGTPDSIVRLDREMH
jgi:monovalent cation:H+ antiporter-2, CPA2 family